MLLEAKTAYAGKKKTVSNPLGLGHLSRPPPQVCKRDRWRSGESNAGPPLCYMAEQVLKLNAKEELYH
jgi:hypothetical protein